MLARHLTILMFVTFISGAYHPAKRQLSFQDACGAGAIDCGSGYCCMIGTECIMNDPPLCRDLLLHDWTMEALDYSSFIELVNLDFLTTLGVTLSTIPKTLTFATALPTYTENPIPSRYTPPTFHPELVTATQTSTGAATGPTAQRELFIGGVIGAGIVLL